MDLRWLDDVLTLLEEGNLSRAAARRNVTQPAFSRRIRSFEDWLGAPILDRKSNRIDVGPALPAHEDEIRALVQRLSELRTKIANYEPSSTTLALSAQHAAIHAVFPEMALLAKATFPHLTFRLRAANLSDCVTTFLRGDTSMMLCYEAVGMRRLEFGPNVERAVTGDDYLVPVVGGTLRYAVRANGSIAADTPAIVYPENSSFGEVLGRPLRPFSSPRTSTNVVCQTAFSGGIMELALRGLGVGWVPLSMVYRYVESGELVSLANAFGQEPLSVAVYADKTNDTAVSLLSLWAKSSSG